MTAEDTSHTDYLDGQMLIAMPAMTDPRFAKSVIYLCAHSAEGAMGIVINRRADNISFKELLQQLNISTAPLNDSAPEKLAAMRVHVGGPVEPGRGFVLHSADYHADTSTLSVDQHVSMTATLDILKAIADGHGPDKALLALGYAGWSPGQLESEILANGWLHCPARSELIFDLDIEHKYAGALATIGVDPAKLTLQAGHA